MSYASMMLLSMSLHLGAEATYIVSSAQNHNEIDLAVFDPDDRSDEADPDLHNSSRDYEY
jgi:hypothetical protein